MGAAQSTGQPYILETPKGKLRGVEYQDRASGRAVLHRFTKIPYARPPIGPLRWRRPQPLPANFSFDDENNDSDGGGTLPGDYTRFGPICPQPEHDSTAVFVEDNPELATVVENTQDEDCLYLNVWVPAGTPPSPSRGWPVQFFIHGGWLQVGNAMQSNEYDPFDLFVHSHRRIIVSSTYRLNLFGFAAGADLDAAIPDAFAGNFGLWDQRLALEWTHANIASFGGDPDLITVGGLSAGAHSALLQLYHDTYLPPERQIIKQVHLYSNALATQPNDTTSSVLTAQFDSICSALSVSPDQSGPAKLDALRAVPWQDLVATIPKLTHHTFRTSTDGPISRGGFCPPTYLSSLHDGSFATRLAARGTRILLGEVRDEAMLYKLVNPPSNHDDLVVQLCNYYPRHVVDALIQLPLYGIPGPSEDASDWSPESWTDVYARIVADAQVHASMRGTIKCLLDPPSGALGAAIHPVPADRVFRYRICWRAKGLDKWIKPEFGVFHASDTVIWWASGLRTGYDETDKKKCLDWIEPFGRFLDGDKNIGWSARSDGGGATAADEVRLLDEEGNIYQDHRDPDWQRGLTVWNACWEAQKGKQ